MYLGVSVPTRTFETLIPADRKRLFNFQHQQIKRLLTLRRIFRAFRWLHGQVCHVGSVRVNFPLCSWTMTTSHSLVHIFQLKNGFLSAD